MDFAKFGLIALQCGGLSVLALGLATPVGAQDEEAAPAEDYSQIDWSEAVANLSGDAAPLFRIKRAGDVGCELAYLDNGTDMSLVVYQIPVNGPSIFTLFAPESMLQFKGENEFTMISVKFPSGGERKLAISQAMYRAVDDPNRGRVLRIQNGFSHEDFRDTGYFNFAPSPPEGEEAEEGGPMVEFRFEPSDVNLAVEVFEGCLKWMERQPQFLEWQAEMATGNE